MKNISLYLLGFTLILFSCHEPVENSIDDSNQLPPKETEVDKEKLIEIVKVDSNKLDNLFIDSLTQVYVDRFFSQQKVTIREGHKNFQDSSYTHLEFLQETKNRWVPLKHILINDSSRTQYYLDPMIDSLTPITDKNRHVMFNHLYTWEMANANNSGKTSGHKVFIVLKGNYITVYDLKNNENTSKPIIHGFVIQHSSGKYVIVDNLEDPEPNEIGGCTDHPYILDFENQQLWVCRK